MFASNAGAYPKVLHYRVVGSGACIIKLTYYPRVEHLRVGSSLAHKTID